MTGAISQTAGQPVRLPRPTPRRRSVVGISISVTTYDEAVDCIADAARRGTPYLVSALAVHGVVEGRTSAVVGRALADFDILTPDGQPVRFALNRLHGAALADRVYGPELMLRLCRRAAADRLPVYLYGSTAEVVIRLAGVLAERFPGLVVAGAEPSLFRAPSEEESVDLGRRVRASGARIVFIGLGCPRQEMFARNHRDIIGLPQVCVGAAFDFHAGTKQQAPRWMQDRGLEWAFRLSREPRRLFVRYATTNTVFVVALARQWIGMRRMRRERP